MRAFPPQSRERNRPMRVIERGGLDVPAGTTDARDRATTTTLETTRASDDRAVDDRVDHGHAEPAPW
jgi:hypothetical protein